MEERLKNISEIIGQLKTAIYSLINEYRRIIHMANFDNKSMSKMCKITDGDIDENGKIYVTQDVMNKFIINIKKECTTEALYWCKYFQALDTFVKNMIDFENPSKTILLNCDDKQLHHLYECWFGDVYDTKMEQGLLSFKRDVEERKQTITVDMFRKMNTENTSFEEETLLQGLPL